MFDRIVNNPKTTLTGAVGFLILVIATGLLFTNRITIEQYTGSLSAAATFLVAIVGILSKDSDK